MAEKGEATLIGPGQHGWSTDVGKVRTLNEDAILCQRPIFAVADGMGGHDGGEVASAIVVETLAALAEVGPYTARALRASLALANQRILEEATERGTATGMGTTVVGVLFGDVPLGFNVGDSRLYVLRSGRLQQISVDHSLVQDLVASGRIRSEDAVHHPERNVVTRAVGSDPHLEVDVWELELEEHDRILICSDGLSGELDGAFIESVLARAVFPSDGAAALVSAALEVGARDNVSVVVIDAVADPTVPLARMDDTNPTGARLSANEG